MTSRYSHFSLNFLIAIWITGAPIYAQSSADNDRAYQQKQSTDRTRLQELLRHPTFLILRLLSSPRDVPREKSTDTPAPYKVKDWISFRLLVSQTLVDELFIATYRNPYYEVRPILMRDGEVIPYCKQAERAIERAETTFPSASELRLKPGVEYELQQINLKDWYEPLAPGRYELTVRRRFDWQGDWVSSTPIYFEVQLRTPVQIPAGVTIELVPEGLQPTKNGIFQLESDTMIRVFVGNNSGQPVRVGAVDMYYSIRPQLLKDKELVPYRAETKNLITSRDADPSVAELPKEFFLDSGTKSGIVYITLKDWYEPLPAGSYRLVARQRFEIDGPWTAESPALLFYIAGAQPK